MEYLHPNITNEEFIDKLKKSIEFNEPLSFSRFGDGEIYFINNNVPPKIIENYLRTMYEEDDVEKGKGELLGIIETALSETDVIGIMDRNNEISKRIPYSEETWSIKTKYIDGLRKSRELIVADHMVTRGEILGGVNNFKHIIQGKNVAIVSPYAKLLKENNIQKLLNVDVNFIETPMAMRFNDRESIFSIFDKITEPIVLYGCSIMGKDFSIHLKNRGKIGLDFGSTLDGWSGLLTKHWFRKNELQSHCLIENRDK